MNLLLYLITIYLSIGFGTWYFAWASGAVHEILDQIIEETGKDIEDFESMDTSGLKSRLKMITFFALLFAWPHRMINAQRIRDERLENKRIK